jgi:hypothetical protein
MSPIQAMISSHPAPDAQGWSLDSKTGQLNCEYRVADNL